MFWLNGSVSDFFVYGIVKLCRVKTRLHYFELASRAGDATSRKYFARDESESARTM